MEKKVLSVEELDNLKQLQEQKNKLMFQLGEIEYKLILIESEKSKIKENLKQHEENSFKLGQNIQQKYGDGIININTGEFTSSK